MGIVIEADEVLDKSRLGSSVGPTVLFNSFTESTAEWKGSVALAVNMPEEEAQKVIIAYGVGSSASKDVGGNVIASLAGWSVVRFPLQATLTSAPQTLAYTISAPVPVSGSIQLPCANKPWHLIGYSCHDPRQLKEVGTACWDKAAALHAVNPIHVMLGTGDQLYNDNVWACTSLQPWFEVKDKAARLAIAPTEEQRAEVAEFYLFAYLRYLKYHPLGTANMASIAQLDQMPESVQHLVFISAVPVAYPELKFVEKALVLVQKTKFLQKTGLYNSIMNEFGEPELLDDVIDHWGSGPHADEKRELLVRLKKLATKRHMRVTLLSGDVHQCTFAYVESVPQVKDGKAAPVAHALDSGFLPQVVSSAICYGPPPDALVKILDTFSSSRPKKCNPGAAPEDALQEVMGELFKEDPPANSTKFANCNNFVEMSLEATPGMQGYSSLTFNLWIKPKKSVTMVVTRIPIPPLITAGTAEQKAAAASLQMDQFKATPKSMLSKFMPCC